MNKQTQQELRFDGADIVHERDAPRLTGQLERVFGLMRDGEWRSLSEIAKSTDAPEASVSAQLRNLRKPRFGRYVVERRHIESGLYQYRITGKLNDI